MKQLNHNRKKYTFGKFQKLLVRQLVEGRPEWRMQNCMLLACCTSTTGDCPSTTHRILSSLSCNHSDELRFGEMKCATASENRNLENFFASWELNPLHLHKWLANDRTFQNYWKNKTRNHLCFKLNWKRFYEHHLLTLMIPPQQWNTISGAVSKCDFS